VPYESAKCAAKKRGRDAGKKEVERVEEGLVALRTYQIAHDFEGGDNAKKKHKTAAETPPAGWCRVCFNTTFGGPACTRQSGS